MSPAAFSLAGIRFAYEPDECIFQDVDLDIHTGERVAVVGPNGSGKTTLLHLMVGLLRPQAGSLEAFGNTRTEERDFFEVRRRAGLAFQDPEDQLFCPTVAEDVAFGPLNLRVPRDEVARLVDRSLNMMGLAGFQDRVTWRLSVGEMKRVALAAVLAMEPEFLLLDEPTAGLDPGSRRALIEILQECDKGIVLVSHDTELIRRLCSRVILLGAGGIVEDSGTADIDGIFSRMEG